MSTGLTPGAKVVDAAAVGLEGVEGESIAVPRLDRALRAGNTALGIGLEIPTPNPTADGRGQLTHRKTPTSPQHIHGILWSPQVAYARKCKAFVMLIALVVTCPNLHP